MQSSAPPQRSSSGAMVTANAIAAVVLAIGGAGGAGAWLGFARQGGWVSAGDIVVACVLTAGGFAGAWICVSIAYVLHRQRRLSEMLTRMWRPAPADAPHAPVAANSTTVPVAPATPARSAPPQGTAPPLRPEPYAQPDQPAPQPATAMQLEAAPAQPAPEGACNTSVARARRQAEDLMAVANFGDAEAVARDLVESYPSDEDARRLLEHVHREGRAFAMEQRRRLYDEVDRMAGSHRWRAAAAAARRLLEDYPNSQEADLVAEKMATLEENARMEEARELRDRIRDMLQRRRYAEAVTLAEDVLVRFPDTRMAAELRGQMDRLRQRAAE